MDCSSKPEARNNPWQEGRDRVECCVDAEMAGRLHVQFRILQAADDLTPRETLFSVVDAFVTFESCRHQLSLIGA